jgi:hypothetical protein
VRLGFPLFVPPLLFLVLLTLAYAIVPWACETQRHYPLHLVTGGALAIVIACAVLAWRNWSGLGVEAPDDSAEPVVWVRFLAVLGLMLSALLCVGVAALLIAQFILPPCVR